MWIGECRAEEKTRSWSSDRGQAWGVLKKPHFALQVYIHEISKNETKERINTFQAAKARWKFEKYTRATLRLEVVNVLLLYKRRM